MKKDPWFSFQVGPGPGSIFYSVQVAKSYQNQDLEWGEHDSTLESRVIPGWSPGREGDSEAEAPGPPQVGI
jgi:hypothetical protein